MYIFKFLNSQVKKKKIAYRAWLAKFAHEYIVIENTKILCTKYKKCYLNLSVNQVPIIILFNYRYKQTLY